jgi:hypothetical protein
MTEFYHPSGKFSPAAIILIPVVTTIASSILGIVYAYLTWYNPLIYLGIIFPIGYGFASYKASSWILLYAPVRNKIIAFVLFFLGGFIGYVFHALVWLNLFVNQTDKVFSLGSGKNAFSVVVSTVDWSMLYNEVFHIDYAVNYLFMVLDQGVWTLFGNPIWGLTYKLIWLAELLICTIVLAFLSANEAAKPFSESQGRYLERKVLNSLLKVPYDLDDLKYKFEQGEYGYVMVAAIEPEKKYNHLKVELYYLEGIGDAYITVTLVTHTTKETKNEKLIEYAGMPKIQADQLLRRLGG